MKLYLSMLEKLIELPSNDPKVLWQLFDDLGLVVKGLEESPTGPLFTIETLANRGDHLHALGVAREVSARFLTSLKHPSVASNFEGRKTSVLARNLTTKCLRYALLEMSLPRPMKLRSDIGAIMTNDDDERHPIVTLINFVLLELGQPMHAFDRDKIEGEIVIDVTKTPSEIKALDGRTYQVPADSVVIRDKKHIVAVGGVIGCENSMVTSTTERVLVESASFDPLSVRMTARAMGISTDASYVFERGCDVESVLAGLKRLVHLAEGSGGAVSDSGSAHVMGVTYLEGQPPEKRKIILNIGNIRSQMNLPRLNEVEITSRLKNLGYQIEKGSTDKEFQIIVPSWRLWDVKHEEDLIEDFIRSHGLNKVKFSIPPLDYEEAEKSPVEGMIEKVESGLHGNGFYEVITKSFCSNEDVDLLAGLDSALHEKHITIKGAREKSYSHLKVTNVLAFSRLAAQNHKRGILSCKVYEFGRLFSRGGAKNSGYEYEQEILSLGCSGRWYEHEFKKGEGIEDLLRLFKGVIESTARALGQVLAVTESRIPFLHPGQQASVIIGKKECGFFGVVHPLIRDAVELRHDMVYAELDVQSLVSARREPEFTELIDYPFVRRDVTLRIGDRDPAETVNDFIRSLKEPLLKDISVIDNFRKPEETFRRVTYRLSFQSPDRTLEHGEVDSSIAGILAALKERKGVELA